MSIFILYIISLIEYTLNKEIRIYSYGLSLQLDYNMYAERLIDGIPKENMTNIECYTVDEYSCAKGNINYWSDYRLSIGFQFDTVFDNCSDFFYLYDRNNDIIYSVSLNVPPKDSVMHSLLQANFIDKLTIRVKYDYAYLRADPDESSTNITYTVKDKWSLPFDIVCFALNCTEYYNNRYPVLIDPTSFFCLNHNVIL